MEKQKIIIWISASDKKISTNQFHVEAIDMDDAYSQLKECATFEYRIVGVSNYKTVQGKEDKFINKKFY